MGLDDAGQNIRRPEMDAFFVAILLPDGSKNNI
jgi:hypothetical protein